MKLKLKNIGKIESANIDIEGITIITGLNCTGKSTINHALVVAGVKRLSREIGCKANGELIHGKKFYLKNGEFCGIYSEDTNLTLQDFPKVSINKEDWI